MASPTETDRAAALGAGAPTGELPLGALLEGKYRLVRILGRGGMGVVYEASHELLGKAVALKVLAPELAGRKEMVARVMREARAAGATGHPNVVLVTDMGTHEGLPFFVMELLAGENLAELLVRRTRLGVRRATTIVMDVLSALQAVHDRGIVHRDLKPANVMLADDGAGAEVVKVLDFGISKVADSADDPVTTKTGHVMGTPQFMSPEQARAEEVDARTDVHAAGSLLYTLVVGEPPFVGPTSTAALARMLEGKYTPASQRVAEVPAALDAVIARALASNPDARFPSAAAMRAKLAPFARGEVVPVQSGLTDPAFGPPRIDPEEELMPAPPSPPARRVNAGQTDPHGIFPTIGRRAPRSEVMPTDTKLELGTPFDTGGGATVRRRRPLPWGTIAVVTVVAALMAAGWTYRDALLGVAEDAAGSLGEDSAGTGEAVLLMVDTTPKDALVFVDDTQRSDHPIRVPKSDTPVSIRVEAPGFAPKTIQVQPQRTRRLQIELEPLAGGRKRRRK
jgi:serine/threonine protein kinase